MLKRRPGLAAEADAAALRDDLRTLLRHHLLWRACGMLNRYDVENIDAGAV